MRKCFAITLGALALTATSALAQVQPMPKVRPGQTVWVTRQDGTIVTGNVQAVAETGLALRDGKNETSLALADIRQIDTTDSLTNGIIIGQFQHRCCLGSGQGLGPLTARSRRATRTTAAQIARRWSVWSSAPELAR